MIAIIADDLTGALDAAAPLRRQGFRAVVALTPQSIDDALDADVVAITTESRSMPAPDPILKEVVAALPADHLLFKKIDSTLRGPIDVELRHTLGLTGRSTALVAPALPHQGRALVAGSLVIDGRVTGVHLPTLLMSSGLPVIVVGLALVRDAEALTNTLQRACEDTALVVVDAETDDDLRAIMEAVAELPVQPVLVGSAGLAAWLPLVGALTPSVDQEPPIQPITGAVLWAFGSAHPRTSEQVNELRGAAHIIKIDSDGDDWVAHVALGADMLARGRDVVMQVVPPAGGIRTVPIDDQRAVVQRLGRMVAAVVVHTPVEALVLGGGDTAYAVCDALGIRHLTLVGEVLPGLPLSHGTTSAGHGVRCITKAGGFGAPDALRYVHAALHGAIRR